MPFFLRVVLSWCLRGGRCTFAIEDLEEGGGFDVLLFWFFVGDLYEASFLLFYCGEDV